MPQLNLALAHLKVERGRPDENLNELLRLFHQAADQGAQIVAGPEMSLSGYSFESREEIEPLAQSADGPAGRALAHLARERQIYIVAAWAERDLFTGILYNSAFVFGPDGTLLTRYRKVNAESRWACPGPAAQNNVFDTPWGRMGVLVCADSYHSLLPRVTALKGADLIFVPANWPSHGLIPGGLWRMRAMENGCYLAAVNRTGLDKNMDCRSGFSSVISPSGEMLLNQKSDDTELIRVCLPLNEEGRLAGLRREEIMASRRPAAYYRALGTPMAVPTIGGQPPETSPVPGQPQTPLPAPVPGQAAGEAAAPEAALPPSELTSTVGAPSPSPGEMSIKDMFLGADPVVQGVMLLLMLASLATWVIIFEKTFVLRRVSRSVMLFKKAAAKYTPEIQEKDFPPLALPLVRAGLRESGDSAGNESRSDYRERVERSMRASLSGLMDRVGNRVLFLATVGAVSPFVGLFGTVWGIMHSFIGIAASGETTLAVVAPGIAEALFATAMGLVAAIPAVIAYNKITGTMKKITKEALSGIGFLGNRLARKHFGG